MFTLSAGLVSLFLQAETPEFRFPLEPVGPQSVAMGGAGVALPRDAEGSVNPAAIAEAPRLSLYRYEGYAGYKGFVIAGHVDALDRLAVGVGFRHFDYGRIIEDDLAADVGDLGASEQAFSLTVAGRVSSVMYLGVSVAYLAEDYFGSVTSATVVSLGTVASYSRRGSLGVALRTLGGFARNHDFGTRYKVPTRLRVGGRQQMPLGGGFATVVADAELRLRDRAAADLHAGAEWNPVPFFSLRSGIESLENPDVHDQRDVRWTVGVGIAVAKVDLGLGARFGGAEGADELFLGVDAFRKN